MRWELAPWDDGKGPPDGGKGEGTGGLETELVMGPRGGAGSGGGRWRTFTSGDKHQGVWLPKRGRESGYRLAAQAEAAEGAMRPAAPTKSGCAFLIGLLGGGVCWVRQRKNTGGER